MNDIHTVLKKYWGYDQFRPLQEDIIRSILEGDDTLALMPTGGGKSICFQVPAMAKEGICIVVSPLIALMKDQVQQLKKRRINAVALYSGMSHREIDITLDNCVYGNVRFLYLSPERLQTEILQERAKKMNINLLAIDEAHCISQWGYDFRPPYLQINEFRKLLGNVPCIALTATATEIVKEDIQEKLAFQNPNVFQKSFARSNLSYSAFEVPDKERKMTDILQKVHGTAIVYVNSRRKTKEIADYLQKQRISADFYHAGLTNEQRSRKQNDWITNKIRVIVATNAFGMGIDKPDVRVVIHLDLPQTLEAYYQEAGRAGRDEKKAYAVALFYRKDLDELKKRTAQCYPDLQIVRNVYQRLANYFRLAVGSHTMKSFDFELREFCKTYKLDYISTFYALKLLERQGFIQFSESFFNPSKLQIRVSKSELYTFQIENAKLDPFIKLLLRNYGGMIFTNFVQISELQLARQYKTQVQNIKKILNYLSQNQIINYSIQKDIPQITFTSERVNAENLSLNLEEIEQAKKRDFEKTEAVAQYVSDVRICRTKLLLSYFGETNYETCGVCDNCLKNNRKQSKKPSESKETKILTALKYTALGADELLETLNLTHFAEEDYLDAIRSLLEMGQIRYNNNGDLEVAK